MSREVNLCIWGGFAVRFSCLVLLLLLAPLRAFPSVALLLEQPHGRFGSINPTGHVAVYFSRICAATPTHLRRCQPGEDGVVISRYHHVTRHDWLAVPLIPYLYAVDSISEIPDSVSPKKVASLRDAWRREHLEELIPEAKDRETPRGNWIQLVGALYVRTIFAYELPTTPAQDDAFILKFNHQRNHSHFNLLFHNCADFARGILNFYYPGSVRRSYSADLGITTPKQVAKSFVKYADHHKDLEMRKFILPQSPGTVARSKRVDGVLESILRKKYVVPIAVVQPYVAAAIAVTYITGGRFDTKKGAEPLNQSHLVAALTKDRPPQWDLSKNSEAPSPLGQALGYELKCCNSSMIHPFRLESSNVLP